MAFRCFPFLLCIALITSCALPSRFDEEEIGDDLAAERARTAIFITNAFAEINSLNSYPRVELIEDRTNRPKEFARKKIDRLLAHFDKPEDIGSVARLSWNYFQIVEGQKLGCLYEYTFWSCVHMLIERGDTAAEIELDTLRQHYANDAGPAEFMDDALRSLEYRKNHKP